MHAWTQFAREGARPLKKLRVMCNDVSPRVKKTYCGHPTGGFYSRCGELEIVLIRFGKKTVGTVLRHRLKLL